MALLGITPGTLAAAQQPLNQMQTVAEPFVWGQGGRRMTPEDIAFAQRQAAQRMSNGGSYAPVDHWLQGAARASEGIIGGLQMRDARRASEVNAAESDMVVRALMEGGAGGQPGGNRDAVIAAMLNPNISDQARGFAESEWARMNPKPLAPTEFERTLQGAGIMPGTPQWTQSMQGKVSNTIDPITVVPTPHGPYVGPMSKFAETLERMKGGDPASTGQGGVAAPDALPPDFDFGGPTPPASGTFRR
jgi:hypothetical protein